MNLWESLEGMLELRLTAADPEDTLRRIGLAGIPVFSIRRGTDPLTRTLKIRRKDYGKFQKIAISRGNSVEICRRRGIHWQLTGLLRRPVLVIGFLVLMALTLWIPSRILFIEVEGCDPLTARQVLASAEEMGLSFCTSRRNLRSEQVKNGLLEVIPRLQWVGVNTKGCLAVVTVRLRQETEPMRSTGGVSSIVASRDGVIREITVERGSGLCKVGDAVKAGQVLISGYTDCGLTVRATQASGEVYASTVRTLTSLVPAEWTERRETGRLMKNISVIFGKKRINLFGSSGIFHTGCVKMYEEYDLTLPGGFVLPVSLAVEVWRCCETQMAERPPDSALELLSRFNQSYIAEQTVAGQILSSAEATQIGDGVLRLHGVYACREMIGQIRNEEIIQ